jgi:hypothetical protein
MSLLYSLFLLPGGTRAAIPWAMASSSRSSLHTCTVSSRSDRVLISRSFSATDIVGSSGAC